MKPQKHICGRCGKEMTYAEKCMVYFYRTEAHGRLIPRSHIDLCEECARKARAMMKKYFECASS